MFYTRYTTEYTDKNEFFQTFDEAKAEAVSIQESFEDLESGFVKVFDYLNEDLESGLYLIACAHSPAFVLVRYGKQ